MGGRRVLSLRWDYVFSWQATAQHKPRHRAGHSVEAATTAVALLGFSIRTEFWQLCLWGIPYGLGAGSVDAALNNYVALHMRAAT